MSFQGNPWVSYDSLTGEWAWFAQDPVTGEVYRVEQWAYQDAVTGVWFSQDPCTGELYPVEFPSSQVDAPSELDATADAIFTAQVHAPSELDANAAEFHPANSASSASSSATSACASATSACASKPKTLSSMDGESKRTVRFADNPVHEELEYDDSVYERCGVCGGCRKTAQLKERQPVRYGKNGKRKPFVGWPCSALGRYFFTPSDEEEFRNDIESVRYFGVDDETDAEGNVTASYQLCVPCGGVFVDGVCACGFSSHDYNDGGYTRPERHLVADRANDEYKIGEPLSSLTESNVVATADEDVSEDGSPTATVVSVDHHDGPETVVSMVLSSVLDYSVDVGEMPSPNQSEFSAVPSVENEDDLVWGVSSTTHTFEHEDSYDPVEEHLQEEADRWEHFLKGW